MMMGAVAVPLIFLKTIFLYVLPAFKQITAPGFNARALPSTRYVFDGTVYVHPQAVRLVVVPAVAVVDDVCVVDVSNNSSSEHCINVNIVTKAHTFATTINAFFIKVINSF